MWFALAIKYWRGIAIAFAIIAAFGWYKLQVSNAYNAGVEAERTAARIEAGNRIVEMEKSDEAFRNLPALERCRTFMRSVGLSADECR